MGSEKVVPADILATAETLRHEIGHDFYEQLTESIYADASRIANRAIVHLEKPTSDWNRTIDRLVTSRTFGFPIMLLMLTLVFWIHNHWSQHPFGNDFPGSARHYLPATKESGGNNRVALVGEGRRY